MLARLVRQELSKLLPWIWLLAALSVLPQIADLLWSAPDRAVWATSTFLFNSLRDYTGIAIFAVALLLCYSGFPRDSDDGTLSFVFSLPVPRAYIFLAKVIAPGLVLSGDVLLTELLQWACHLWNPTSFGGRTFRADWQGWVIALSLALSWIGVGYGQLLTVLRRFGLLLCFSFYSTLRLLERDVPWLRALDPARVLHVEFQGQRAIIPWTTLAAHALGALLACSLAACIWVGPVERIAASFARWARRPLLAGLVGLTFTGLGIALLMRVAGRPKAKPPVSYGHDSVQLDSTPVVLRTRHYELRYPKGLATRIELLATAADGLHEKLAERLGVGAGEHVVLVDFQRRSATHAGSATWNTIRMDPFMASDSELLERTFAHETTHVLSFQASDRRLSTEGDAVGFFSEGLAEALALELRPSEAASEALQLEAALAYRRLHPSFGELIHYANFRERHGPLLAYPLGFIWTRALLSSCGRDAPRHILAALGRADAPLKLPAEGLWQHLLQRAHCDIVRVNAAWESQLAAAASALAAEIERVPDLVGGTPRLAGDEVRVRARIEGAAPDGMVFSLAVRTRVEAEQRADAFFATPSSEGELEFLVPSNLAVEGMLQFQLGLRFERRGFPVHFARAWAKSRVAD
jgi:hypothetical protein